MVHSGPPGSGFLWTFWITGVSRNSNQMSPLPVVPGWVSMYSHLIARVSLVPAQVALEGSSIVPVCQIPFEVPLREAYPQPPRVPQFSWRMPSLLPSISSWKRHLITPPQSLSALQALGLAGSSQRFGPSRMLLKLWSSPQFVISTPPLWDAL